MSKQLLRSLNKDGLLVLPDSESMRSAENELRVLPKAPPTDNLKDSFQTYYDDLFREDVRLCNTLINELGLGLGGELEADLRRQPAWELLGDFLKRHLRGPMGLYATPSELAADLSTLVWEYVERRGGEFMTQKMVEANWPVVLKHLTGLRRGRGVEGVGAVVLVVTDEVTKIA